LAIAICPPGGTSAELGFMNSTGSSGTARFGSLSVTWAA
jgi:hypothetical protein